MQAIVLAGGGNQTAPVTATVTVNQEFIDLVGMRSSGTGLAQFHIDADIRANEIILRANTASGGMAVTSSTAAQGLLLRDFGDTFAPITGVTVATSTGFGVFADFPQSRVSFTAESVTLDFTNTTHSGTLFNDLYLNVTFGGILGTAGDNALTGTDAYDFFDGGAGADTIFAQDGADTIWGGDGVDIVQAGAGNDLVHGEAGNDILFGGEFGVGGVRAGSGDDTMTGGDGNDSAWGFDGVDEMSGGAGDDAMLGGAGDDTLNGDAGNDSLFGGDFAGGGFAVGSGDDTMNGGDGTDGLWGMDGVDVMNGGAGNDYLEGGADGDTMDGGADNDFILGGLGNDTVTGGAGFDYLYGEGGADQFVFRPGDSYDWALDFSVAQGDTFRVSTSFGWINLDQVKARMVDTSFGGTISTTLTSTDGLDQMVVFGARPTDFTATNLIFI